MPGDETKVGSDLPEKPVVVADSGVARSGGQGKGRKDSPSWEISRPDPYCWWGWKIQGLQVHLRSSSSSSKARRHPSPRIHFPHPPVQVGYDGFPGNWLWGGRRWVLSSSFGSGRDVVSMGNGFSAVMGAGITGDPKCPVLADSSMVVGHLQPADRHDRVFRGFPQRDPRGLASLARYRPCSRGMATSIPRI